MLADGSLQVLIGRATVQEGQVLARPADRENFTSRHPAGWSSFRPSTTSAIPRCSVEAARPIA
jgi:hypothetical protein